MLARRIFSGLLVSFVAGCAVAPDEPRESVESAESEWSADSPTEAASSTHLWLVERALGILARHENLPRAKATRRLMLGATCKRNWQQALFDADHLHEYNDGWRDLAAGASEVTIALSGASWKSHFYDPDTGKNYKGETDPTGLTQTLRYLEAARADADRNMAAACYSLGLSLHYLTDLTQPMHAANFTALDKPVRLHTNLEHFAEDIQDGYRLADWSGAPSANVRAFVLETARSSKRTWQAMFGAVSASYAAMNDHPSCDRIEGHTFDYPECWNTNATVRRTVGSALQRAQDATAKYLYLVGGLD